VQFLDYSLGALGAGVCAWLLVGLWIRISLRAKILDVPNARSSHARITPRAGGVGIVVTVVAGVAIALAFGRAGDLEGALWAGGLAVFIAAISFIDDVRSLPSLLRLVFQVGAAALAVWKLGPFTAATLPFLQPVLLPPWLMVYNFMDGIDGIAGGQGLVAGLAWAWFGMALNVPLVAWTGLIVAASCLGFLFHNWSPAKVFMGDVGSAFLGFVFAVLPLLALRGTDVRAGYSLFVVGGVPVFAALVVWPFVSDGAFTFVRRLKHRENVLAAHRSHLYQRLTIAGWSHALVSRFYICWAIGCAVLGAVYLRTGHIGRLVVLGGCALSLIAVYRVVKATESSKR
jgi:UDP-N-acetylmuramyl pentapeptide phosphotransferase/UDP-N-acetylglucosamine-1-phosphate transferase